MQTNFDSGSVSEPLVTDYGRQQFGHRIRCVSSHRIGFCVAVLALSAGASLTAQPTITAAVNNASYPRRGLLNYGIAQGSLFAIFGTGLASPGTQASVSSFPIPTEMAGVSIQISGTGTVANAPIIYVTDRQVGAILPSGTPLGNATATLSYQGRSSNSFPIRVVRRSFGIFTLNAGGTGPAVAQNFISALTQPVNTVLNPARPGQTVTLWGTGLGPVDGDEVSGPRPGDLKANIRVNVGGKNASVRYAGRSGCCAAVDQIVFDVPVDVSGCYVPLVVLGSPLNDTTVKFIQAEAQQSNFTTISVSSDGAPCTDPAGLSGVELANLQQAGTLRVGALRVSRLFPFALGALQEDAAAALSRSDPSTFLRSRGIFGFPSLGSCLTYPLDIEESAIDPYLAAPLDAGSALNISGPSGSRQLPRQSTGAYAGLLGGGSSALYLNAGSYTVDNGAGGSDVGPFQASFSVPQPLKWLDKGVMPRSFVPPVVFTWSDADPNGFVVMTSFGNNGQVAVYSVCTERSDAGALSIPPVFLVTLGVDGEFGKFPNNFSLGVARTFRFDAPGLDAGLISVMLMDGFFAP
jgi:uncharacterized protein (TIGR03437 family)